MTTFTRILPIIVSASNSEIYQSASVVHKITIIKQSVAILTNVFKNKKGQNGNSLSAITLIQQALGKITNYYLLLNRRMIRVT